MSKYTVVGELPNLEEGILYKMSTKPRSIQIYFEAQAEVVAEVAAAPTATAAAAAARAPEPEQEQAPAPQSSRWSWRNVVDAFKNLMSRIVKRISDGFYYFLSFFVDFNEQSHDSFSTNQTSAIKKTDEETLLITVEKESKKGPRKCSFGCF